LPEAGVGAGLGRTLVTAEGREVCRGGVRIAARRAERLPYARPMRRSLFLLAPLCCIGGCQSLLGIEDLSEAPRPGMAAGAAGAAGAGASGGSAGAAPGTGGTENGGGTGGTSAAAGSGGTEAEPDAGLGDAGVGGPITVAGRVVDFFRRPAPGLRVTIGEREAITGENGEFSIDDVVAPYDVSLIASTTQSDFTFRYYAYVYQGLTRPDPMLQVYYGRPQRSSTVNLTVSGATFTDDTRRLIFAFSSPDGYYAASGINFEAPSLFLGWGGPEQTAGNAHGLLVLRASSDTGAPPLAYEAYQTTPLALSDEATSSLGLDMTAEAIPQATLTGSVDSGAFGEHTQLIEARFADGTVLPLLSADSSQAAFSLLVPSLPNASLTVAASAGPPGYSVAHVDGVPAAADQNIALVLPRPVSLNAPAGGSSAGPGTTFAWSTVGQSARVFVWHLESESYFEGIYVITSQSEITYPEVPGYSLTLPSPDEDFAFYWSVETHGDHASVDAATGPEGLFDSFALEKNIGTGALRGGQGYHTNSDIRFVTIPAQ
jgi:hypothetical protein